VSDSGRVANVVGGNGGTIKGRKEVNVRVGVTRKTRRGGGSGSGVESKDGEEKSWGIVGENKNVGRKK